MQQLADAGVDAFHLLLEIEQDCRRLCSPLRNSRAAAIWLVQLRPARVELQRLALAVLDLVVLFVDLLENLRRPGVDRPFGFQELGQLGFDLLGRDEGALSVPRAAGGAAASEAISLLR